MFLGFVLLRLAGLSIESLPYVLMFIHSFRNFWRLTSFIILLKYFFCSRIFIVDFIVDFIYQGSLQALTIKLKIKQQI